VKVKDIAAQGKSWKGEKRKAHKVKTGEKIG
jgi:hypothetical protein